MPLAPWVATIGSLPPPLSVANGGTGATTPGAAVGGLGLTGLWLPGDDGFLGANMDPGPATASAVVTAGTLYMVRLPVRVATTITNLWLGINTIGAGASTGSFMGLYSASGTLLSGSADCGAILTGSVGYKAVALTTPQAVVAGTVVYGALLCNLATTQVTVQRGVASGPLGSPQTAANAATTRWGQFAAQGTSLPASLTMSSMAATAYTLPILWN